jgi:urea transport system permease protein
MNSLKQWIERNGLGNVALLALVLLVAFPLALDLFRLNLVGKYLSYSFVALGLVMLWGYGGVLSLGQGVFFGLGGYGMAMFLKLEASDPITTKIQSTPGIPDFMDWNQITALPIWWKPFQSFPLTCCSSWWCPRCWPSSSATPCSSAVWAACTSPSSRRPWR